MSSISAYEYATFLKKCSCKRCQDYASEILNNLNEYERRFLEGNIEMKKIMKNT